MTKLWPKMFVKKDFRSKKNFIKKIEKKNFEKKMDKKNVVKNLWSIDFGQKKMLVKKNQKIFGQMILVTM